MHDEPQGPWTMAGPHMTVGSAVRARDLLAAVLLAAGLLLAMRLTVGAPARSVEAVLFLLALQSAILLGVVYAVIVRGRGLGWEGIGFRPVPRRWIWIALLVALVSLPLVGAVNYATQVLAGEPFRNPQVAMLAPGGFSWTGLAGMLVMAGIVAPVVEEIVFRGLLYGWLRARLAKGLAVLLSAVAFALVHGILMLVPALAVQGVLLALLYERSGSLWPPVVMHGLFNAIMTMTLYAALASGLPID